MARKAWNKGIKWDSKMRKKHKGTSAKYRKNLIRIKEEYSTEIDCALCGKKVVTKSPVRKYCHDCSKKVRAPITDRKPNFDGSALEWRRVRKEVVKRDGCNCRICGKHVGNSIHFHHRDGNNGDKGLRGNNDINNLVCLCNSCHTRLTGIEILFRNYDKEFLLELVMDFYKSNKMTSFR